MSMLSRLRNGVWLAFEYGWYPLLLLLSTPFLLSQLGPEQYGQWMLLNSIVSLGVVLNAGTSVAVIKDVSAHLGRQRTAEVEGTFRSALAMAILGGSALSILVYTAVGVLGAAVFDSRRPSSLHLTAVAAALLIWIEQLDNVCTSTLKAAEKFGIAAKAEIVTRAVQVAGVVLAVFVEADLATLYAALVLAALVRLAIKGAVVRRTARIQNFAPRFEGLRSVLVHARWGWIQGAASVCYGILDRLLIGSMLGASILTYYSLAAQLAQQSYAFTAAAMSLLFPIVSRTLAADPSAPMKRVFYYSNAIALLSSGVLAMVLLLFGDPILHLWLGRETAAHVSPVLEILTIAYWILSSNISSYYMLLGAGRVKETAIVNLAAGVLMLVCMAVLIRPYGIQGVGAARIVYGAVSGLALLWIAHRTTIRPAYQSA